jgi:hypothetical protein
MRLSLQNCFGTFLYGWVSFETDRGSIERKWSTWKVAM